MDPLEAVKASRKRQAAQYQIEQDEIKKEETSEIKGSMKGRKIQKVSHDTPEAQIYKKSKSH